MEWVGIFVPLAVVMYIAYAVARPAPVIDTPFDTRISNIDIATSLAIAADRLSQAGPADTKLIAREGTTLVFEQGRGATMMGAFYRLRLTPSGEGHSKAEIGMKTRVWEMGSSVTRAHENFVEAVRKAAG